MAQRKDAPLDLKAYLAKARGGTSKEYDAKLDQRRAAIISVAGEIFDFGEMAKRSLG